MCGICGMFERQGGAADPVRLRRMNRTLRHRGPDGEGEYLDGEIALGHRRLSIIDVGGGGQPIGNEDGQLQIVFNGEIYNFIELRAELESAGHRFRTRSDTEVIVHAYEQWGPACVERFNGMFAFAIWDGRRRELFLARDHLGVKPLYYVQAGGVFLFASEIKALLDHPACPRHVDLDALAELFTFRYVPSPRTLFDQIRKLPPAHRMLVSRAHVHIERFWTLLPRPRRDRRETALVEEYQALLEDAVRLQLRSDVPLGLFLSSGVDSAALLAIMSRHAGKGVQCFTVGFEDGERTNEVDAARALARRFGAEHHGQTVTADDYTRYYERYMQDIEEPVGNETAAAFYFVSRLTSRRVKVALTGQGADEPWAGYDRHKGIKLSDAYSRLPAPLTCGLRAAVNVLPGRLERLKRGVDALAEPDLLTRFTKVYSFFSADMKAHLFSGELRRRFTRDPYGTRLALGHLQDEVRHLDPLTQILYIDTRSNLPDDLLMVGDKTAMANSLEARVPFLDYRLVEFIESLPPDLRLRGLTGKYLHRRACRKWLPSEVTRRRKQGFANPIDGWFRNRMRAYVEDCLLSPRSAMADYFDQRYIRRILEEDRAGRQPFRRHIYLLVSLELWHRAFMPRTGQ